MLPPKLLIKLIGRPAVQFGDTPPKSLSAKNDFQLLVDLALQDEAFQSSICRIKLNKSYTVYKANGETFVSGETFVRNNLNRLRIWLKTQCNSEHASNTSYLENAVNRKDGFLKFSHLCDTDLRQFQAALAKARQDRTRSALLDLQAHVERIGQNRLLRSADNPKGWVEESGVSNQELRKHIDRKSQQFEDDLKDARVLLHSIKLFNVPQRITFFDVGQIEVLEKKFSQTEAEPGTMLALIGMGGIGKTTLATEYAYRHKDDYRFVLWLNAADRSSLQSQYEQIAEWQGLVLPGLWESRAEYSRKKVIEWLAYTRRYLLIFDNLNNPNFLNEFLPSNPCGHILITTRLCTFEGRPVVSIPLECYTHEQAMRFFEAHSKGLNILQDRAVLAAIVEAQGGLPLTLREAARALRASPWKTSEQYLQKRKELAQTAAVTNPTIIDADGNQVPSEVYVTFMVSINRLPQAPRELLHLLAFMGSAPFQLDWLRKACTELGEVLRDTILQDPLLLFIMNLDSLCNCSGDAFQLHRVVQAVVRASLSGSEQTLWMRRAVATLHHILPEFSIEARPLYNDLLPHLRAVCLVPDDMVWCDKRMADLLHHMGHYLIANAIMDDAETCVTRCLTIRRQLYARDQAAEPLIEALLGMANYYGEVEERSQVNAYVQEAYKIALRHLPEGHPIWPLIYDRLAFCCCNEKRFEEAAIWVKQGLVCATHPTEIALLRRQMGVIHFFSEPSRYSEAYREFAQAIQLYSDEHAEDIAYCSLNLGRLAAHLGEFERSWEEGNRALEIFARLYGKEHPAYATALLYFAYGRKEEGNLDKAYEYAQQAHAIRERYFNHSRDNPAIQEVANLLEELADLLKERGMSPGISPSDALRQS